MNPGRSFFIWIGVTQTSSAPSANRRSLAYPKTSGVESSMFDSKMTLSNSAATPRLDAMASTSARVPSAPGASLDSPIHSPTTFGGSTESRLPAPYPQRDTDITARSRWSASVATIAAPVGVRDSPTGRATEPPTDTFNPCLRIIAFVAGANDALTPWLLRETPEDAGNGDAYKRSIPSNRRPTTDATTSTNVSVVPSS